MATASSRNELDGGSIKRVTLYDGGGNPASTTNGIPTALVKTALTGGTPNLTVVTATSGAAVPSNGNRKGLTFVNTDASSSAISLGFGTVNVAILNGGITLFPNGSFTMDDYSFTTGAINAIATASGARLAWQEWS